jgi:hypothetical protein
MWRRLYFMRSFDTSCEKFRFEFESILGVEGLGGLGINVTF